MRPVVQLDRTGCAIASVAVLAGRPYREVKAAAGALRIDVADPRLWSDTAPMLRLLRRHGLRAGNRRGFSSWDALPDLALLSIKWHLEASGPAWHWVVFLRRGSEAVVLDSKRSLKSHRRTDFGRMKPKWFIPVGGSPFP
jgi:hypothetical protein